jgi:hypothetical protein
MKTRGRKYKMAEWLKFTFTTEDAFRSRILQKVNGVVPQHEPGVDQNFYIGSGHEDPTLDRPSHSFYVQCTDTMESNPGTHNVQFDLLAAEDESPAVKLESINIEGVDYGIADMLLAPYLKIYTHIDEAMQILLDTDILVAGSIETVDFGYGSNTYSKCEWPDNEGLICGTGSWTFQFDSPLEPWMRSINNN